MDVTLTEQTLASPEATSAINLTSESITTVDVTLNDLLATEHVINVHQSPKAIDVYIACGGLTGTSKDGVLDVNLDELNDSGYTDQATLLDNRDGTTMVTVTIIETAPTTPATTPAA